MVSWLTYTRFLRKRLTKEIPINLTEYGFWFLCYLCIIYLIVNYFIIMRLLHREENNNNKIILNNLTELLYKPLIILDNALKYNKYISNNYCNFMIYIIKYLQKLKEKQVIIIIILFQIVPRIILISFLIIDTFYFHKLEIFYKIILIGILPFLFKYMKYCFRDFKEYYVKLLELKYKFILLFEKNIDYDEDDYDIWDRLHKNKLHNQYIPTKDYIEFKNKQRISQEPKTEYEENPFAFDYIYNDYKKKNNISENVDLSDEIY